ncbi:MAG: hypothetical protein OHK0057_19250 [Thermoflexibacter sp.]
MALFKVKTVNIDKIASGFDSKASTAAVKKRIQRFFNTYFIDYQSMAKFIVVLLYIFIEQGVYLSLDRTVLSLLAKYIPNTKSD